ncbi:MAG: hypothetical protein ACYDCM_02030 [Candidatus Acidiferrales bacterium]
MRFPKKTVTEEVIEKISNLKGPNKAQQGAMLWMASAFASQDVKLGHRSARIAHQMQVSLQKAFPDMDPQFIGDIVADLNSLWDLRQKLDKDLKRLFQMRFPQHRNHLHSFLIDIEVRQLDEASYLIRRLRKRVPKLLKALDRQERGERRRTRTNRPKTVPKLVAQAHA